MPSTVIAIQNASVKFAADAASIATAPDYKCQVISAAVQVEAKNETVPASFCGPEFQRPKQSGWSLVLSFLQDWGDAESLSQYLFDHDTDLQAFSVSLGDDSPTSIASGSCYIVAGPFGGDAQTPLQATSTMPCSAKPTIAGGALLASAS